MNIIRADKTHLEDVAALFNLYAIFYGRDSDLDACRRFVEARMVNEEAVIFLVRDHEANALGFTLLYPSFSSVNRKRIFILNDLFVKEAYRKKGVASTLLNHAADFARNHNALGLHLETHITNRPAQKLYESLGWKKETETFHYNYTL